ncbi:hypothetical protein DTO021D3_2960 [Paecilomyces variotii]|nr:hypothetical protein DTO032I3_8845 [Paecilomyces variotii]KAJ9266263.1 hypothetical protein DTO195F2_1378 [Paecilomyces variotii]KAJ9280043.1 hypothetical protein DTO021D3_2960 [Paecilomyces variotii]KAJ9285463.1 hypothetical protein DTO021C3_6987 [Paecilomyces variotii]KAJ9307459.1 hypothetical protein DTO217A2_2931 [Paecilomyces variotii]
MQGAIIPFLTCRESLPPVHVGENTRLISIPISLLQKAELWVFDSLGVPLSVNLAEGFWTLHSCPAWNASGDALADIFSGDQIGFQCLESVAPDYFRSIQLSPCHIVEGLGLTISLPLLV